VPPELWEQLLADHLWHLLQCVVHSLCLQITVFACRSLVAPHAMCDSQPLLADHLWHLLQCVVHSLCLQIIAFACRSLVAPPAMCDSQPFLADHLWYPAMCDSQPLLADHCGTTCTVQFTAFAFRSQPLLAYHLWHILQFVIHSLCLQITFGTSCNVRFTAFACRPLVAPPAVCGSQPLLADHL